jgi:simple sugar transport system substrate-binding protein
MMKQKSVLAAVVPVLFGLSGAFSVSMAAEKPLSFVMVTQSPVNNPYWAVVAQGLEQAGKDLGVTVQYRGTDADLNDPTQQKRNLDAAVASHPDGLIITDDAPDSLNDSISAATKAGIPVILINSGNDQVKAVGALTYVGVDPGRPGSTGAEQMNLLGAKKALVITTPIGAIPFVDARTNGFRDNFKGATTLAEIPIKDLNDSNRVKTIAETQLQKDSTIDAVFSIGSCCIAAMLDARTDLGDRGKAMHWGTIDVTDAALDALKTKNMDFALNAQQYALGYYPVVLLSLYLRQAIQPATDMFITGPAVITPDNVAKLLAVSGK